MHPRVVMVLALAALLLGGVLLVPSAAAKLTSGDSNPDPIPAPASNKAAPTIAPKVVEPPEPTLAPQPVSVKVDGFYSWALMDLESGRISGSKNSAPQTSSTESMIKTWIVSDYLRQLDASGKPLTKDTQTLVQRAIRNSDDDAAGALNKLGGG